MLRQKSFGGLKVQEKGLTFVCGYRRILIYKPFFEEINAKKEKQTVRTFNRTQEPFARVL